MLKKINVILCFLTMFLFITNVNAKESAKVNKYYIITEPELAGAFEVEEVIEVTGNYEEFNIDLYYKDLSLKEFSGKESDLEASSIYNGTSINLQKLGKLNIEDLDFNKFVDSTGSYVDDNIIVFEEDDQTYKQDLTDEKLKLTIFNKDNDETNYYYIKYVIHNLIVEHNDYAELKYYYLDGTLNYDINELVILSNLPFADPDFKIWVHGPKNGEAIRIEEGNGAVLKFQNVKKNTKVDIRMLYNLNLFPISINESKKSKLDSQPIIEKIENEIQKRTDNNALITNVLKYSIITITVIYFILYLILIIKEYVKYLKCKNVFDEKYYTKAFTDIISIMKLKNNYNVDSYLLDMVSRDVITYKDNYVLLNKNSKFKEIDKSIIKSIFENKDKINLDELLFNKNNINIKKEINYFNSDKYNKILYIIFSLLGILLSFLFIKIIGEEYLSFSIVLCILSFIFLVYSLFFYFSNKESIELSNKYKAFIRYIKDIENQEFDLKLFSNYLVILSIKNKKLISNLDSKYEKEKNSKIYKYEKVKEFMNLLD